MYGSQRIGPAVLMVLAGCLGSASPAFGQAAATRELPGFPGGGVAFTVTLTLHPPAGTIAAGVSERPPAGWTVANISNNGVFDDLTQEIKWGPLFSPADPTVLTYDITPASNATGNECFSGTVSYGGPDLTIEGDTCFITIPSGSAWGLAVTALLVLVTGSLAIRHRVGSALCG